MQCITHFLGKGFHIVEILYMLDEAGSVRGPVEGDVLYGRFIWVLNC